MNQKLEQLKMLFESVRNARNAKDYAEKEKAGRSRLPNSSHRFTAAARFSPAPHLATRLRPLPAALTSSCLPSMT